MTELHYLKSELYQMLQSDSDLLEFLHKSSLDGIWYWDLENPEHEWMSPEFWTTLGYDPGDMPHSPDAWQDLINQEDLRAVTQNFLAHCENADHPYDQIVRYRHADGKTVWVRCRGRAIRNKAGKPIRLLGAHNDVTKQMEMEQRLKTSLKKLDETYASTRLALEESEALFNLSPEAILQVDSAGFILKANQQAIKLFGYPQTELLQKSVDELVPKDIKPIHGKYRENYLRNPEIRPMGSVRESIKALRKDGTMFPVEVRLATINSRFGLRTIATIRDVTETNKVLNELQQKIDENERLLLESTTDALTGAKNRRFFEDAFATEVTNSKRYKRSLSLLLIDIDHFKSVNDTYGHDVGDAVLKKVNDIISETIRSGDVLSRLGGEEFGILAPSTNLSNATALAERIREKIERHCFGDEKDQSRSLTASLGVAELSTQDESPRHLFKKVDEALYEAKNSGRNQVVVGNTE